MPPTRCWCGPSRPTAARSPDAAPAALADLRADRRALVAIAEKPWDFFDHTDLLDFPGARSRLKLANLDDVAKAKGVAEGANPLRELLLRGKVAYLFQRYSAERELSRPSCSASPTATRRSATSPT